MESVLAAGTLFPSSSPPETCKSRTSYHLIGCNSAAPAKVSSEAQQPVSPARRRTRGGLARARGQKNCPEAFGQGSIGPILATGLELASRRSFASLRERGAREMIETKPDMWKRALDLTCLLIGLPGVAFLMVLIAVVILIVSPGPVFYKQERIGFRRRTFICLKFRTMKSGASTTAHQHHLKTLLESDGPMTKMDAAGDPRLIPFGRFLRATGLDELPQLLNVARGEMSLVGPRPCTPYEFEAYRPEHLARFDTLPGLTGLWQVNGKNKTTFSEMIRWDIEYVKKKSVWLDLKIMGATFSALATQVRELRAHS